MFCNADCIKKTNTRKSTLKEHNNNFNLLRLVAALQVLLVHLLNHLEVNSPLFAAFKMFPGVPIFFFISGFLIFTSFERTHRKGNLIFFKNRALRIYPALLVCVAICTAMVVSSGYLQTQNYSITHFVFWVLAQSSILQFYNPDFMRGFGVGVLNGALWTISIELQFYILTPLLYFLITRHRILLGFVFIISMMLKMYLRDHLDWSMYSMKLIYVSFAPWVFMYISGMLVAYYRELFTEILLRIRFLWIVFAYFLSMLFIGAYEVNASNNINPISFMLLAGCIIKLASLRLPLPSNLSNFIARNDFSYGIYLYHMPVLNFIIFFSLFSVFGNFVVASIVVFVAAALSWFYIEKPALEYKS